MTKADILDTLPALKVCHSYSINGVETNEVPFQMNKLDIVPVYESFEGWQSDSSAISNYENLPTKMKEYVQHLNQFLQVPVTHISNGPGRDQIVKA